MEPKNESQPSLKHWRLGTLVGGGALAYAGFTRVAEHAANAANTLNVTGHELVEPVGVAIGLFGVALVGLSVLARDSK